MAKERGQSLVELAISFTVLLYLLVGLVEFGMMFFQFVQLRDAAQEGALYGSIHPDLADEIEIRIRNQSDSPINLNDDTVSVFVVVEDAQGNVKPSDFWCEGDSMTVIVSYPHKVFMPFMSVIIGETVNLRATVTDTILVPVCP